MARTGDDNVTDEFYWAAAEFFITTGARGYRDFLLDSPLHVADVWRDWGFDWGNTAQLGRLQLATLPNRLPDRDRVRQSVITGADKYLATLKAHPYGIPYAPADNTYDWGSNNLILNNAIVMAVAFDITGTDRYRDGVLETMDYIFGRNALHQSYVTGYREVASENQHSHWYAHHLNTDLPNPPRGTPVRRSQFQHPGPGRPAETAGLRAAVLLPRRHRIVVDQRVDHQLERAAGLAHRVRRRPGQRRRPQSTALGSRGAPPAGRPGWGARPNGVARR